MELQAEIHLQKGEWTEALDLYNNLVQQSSGNEEEQLAVWLNRSRCLYKLGNYENVTDQCNQILNLFIGVYDSASEQQTRILLIRSLLALNKLDEAEIAIKEWLIRLKQSNGFSETMALENVLERFFSLESKQHRELWLNGLERKFCNTQMAKKGEKEVSIVCIYCNLSFQDKADLSNHCLTQEHETMIMSDEGHDWNWRAPPRGFKSDAYTICENWRESETCRFGIQCVEAHGEAEFLEWKERFQYREMKLLRAKEKQLYGKSYTEDLLEKLIQTSNTSAIMRDKLAYVEDICKSSLSATVTSKNSNHEWQFSLKTDKSLQAVALLQDTHRNHFHLSQLYSGSEEILLKNNQEYISFSPSSISETLIEYHINVVFQTNIFGTFRQMVVFDFGNEPILVKHLCVDVMPDSDLEKLHELRKEMIVSTAERWTSVNSDILAFSSSLVTCGTNSEWEQFLKAKYSCVQLENYMLSHTTLSSKKITPNDYRQRMHELLWMEEIERCKLIAQYNLTTKLQIAHSYLLSPNSMAASTAKYSGNGELFASIHLGKELSEDTSEGRLILMHCNSVYLMPKRNRTSRRVYEALIEDKGKNMIYLRLSAVTVAELQLTPDTDLEVQIQFQLNRLPYCEWHYTVDKIRNFKLIFPDTYVEPKIPWSPSRQWSSALDSRLNLKQKEAVVAITTPLAVKIPPILVIGPFGTGKTFTLAQAIRELIKDDGNKILLCTHSNSAADLYIKDYLDPWVEAGNESARPLRIYYQKRWVATVSPTVQKYCSIKLNGNTREFQVPTIEDIAKHKIVVVTLSTSVYLSAMALPLDTFTHILLDEAAQALECETITPLALASESTRIVLAGDHMQLGPDIFSDFARERNLHISLLERLYDFYPTNFPCKILLCENYRSHEAIIHFTSESFYDQKLVSSSKQPKHSKFYPLTFFTTRGEDVQDKNSTAFYNNSEVYEVVERVVELKRNWPKDWGDLNEQSIGVVTPYSDQVFRIRSELRKRKVDVCVERVLNVQGKQFRALILSTVRTRRTCNNKKHSESNVNYGFLSNSKLLNTAITRAQSLVAVVGDPIALCSLGRCSKVWERFIQICNENGSLFGISWTDLKFQLDGIELKNIYTLNPLAPEFFPRNYKEPKKQVQSPIPIIPIYGAKHIPPYSGPPVIPFLLPVHRPISSPYMYNFPAGPIVGIPNRPVVPVMVPQTHPIAVSPVQMANKPNSCSIKLIQFMNNVHFPERDVLSDCVNLLPHDMSLAEMLRKPANIQELWYNHLRENAGHEAAAKFKYLLHTTNQKGTRTSDPNLFGRNTPSSSDSPTFNWYDSPQNQINFNKPIYMREGERPLPENNTSNPLYKRRARAQKPIGGSNGVKDGTQRDVEEDFTQMNDNNYSSEANWRDVFRAFSSENTPNPTQSLQNNLAEPRLYKYFS